MAKNKNGKLPTLLLLATSLNLPELLVSFSVQNVQHVDVPKYHLLKKYGTVFTLAARLDEKNDQAANSSDVQVQDNFDGKGFANYLGPYAVALAASVVVTAAFVKFVLMDY